MRTILLALAIVSVCFVAGLSLSPRLRETLRSPTAEAATAEPALEAVRLTGARPARDETDWAAGCAADTPEQEAYRRVTAGGRKLASVIRFGQRANVADRIARADVARLAPAIEQNIERGFSVRLVGHTDSEGDALVNRRIAMDRAEAARWALEQRGIYGVQVESAGEMCPIESNDTEAGREANRRVEIWLVREG